MKLKLKSNTSFTLTVEESNLSDYIKQKCLILRKTMDKLMCQIFEVNKVEFEDDGDPYAYHESSMFFHIVLDSTYIGYFICNPGQFKKSVWISEFYIEEAYRSQGYGQQALKDLKEILHKKGYKKIALTVIEGNPAEKLYRKMGFNQIIATELLCKL